MHIHRELDHIISEQQVSAGLWVCQIHQLSLRLPTPVRFLLVFPALFLASPEAGSLRNGSGCRGTQLIFVLAFYSQPVVWMTQGQLGEETARQRPLQSSFTLETL